MAWFALLGIRRIRRNALVFNYYWSRHFRVNDWFYTGGKHDVSTFFCMQLEVVTCTLLHWFAPVVLWQHDNMIFVCRWSQQRVSSRILLTHLALVSKIYYQGLEIWRAFLSVLSRFPNMKGFYWALRLDLSLSCNQMENNFDLTCPKLLLTCPKLSLTWPKLSPSCPRLLLSCP